MFYNKLLLDGYFLGIVLIMIDVMNPCDGDGDGYEYVMWIEVLNKECVFLQW